MSERLFFLALTLMYIDQLPPILTHDDPIIFGNKLTTTKRNPSQTDKRMSSYRGPIIFFAGGIRKHSLMPEMERFWDEQDRLYATSSRNSPTDYCRKVLVPQLLEQKRIYQAERLENGEFDHTPIETFEVALQKARDKLGRVERKRKGKRKRKAEQAEQADNGVDSGSTWGSPGAL